MIDSSQLEKISRQLDRLTNPRFTAWNSFVAGIFHALGSLFGTAVIATAIIYFLSQVNLTQLTSRFLESTMSQINWASVMPSTPTP